jgi:apoptotic chromatin condensation inducer in the nucleus
MSQNSFIKQYLAQQQELLRQRLEREAREAAEADGKDIHNKALISTLAYTT